MSTPIVGVTKDKVEDETTHIKLDTLYQGKELQAITRFFPSDNNLQLMLTGVVDIYSILLSVSSTSDMYVGFYDASSTVGIDQNTTEPVLRFAMIIDTKESSANLHNGNNYIRFDSGLVIRCNEGFEPAASASGGMSITVTYKQ